MPLTYSSTLSCLCLFWNLYTNTQTVDTKLLWEHRLQQKFCRDFHLLPALLGEDPFPAKHTPLPEGQSDRSSTACHNRHSHTGRGTLMWRHCNMLFIWLKDSECQMDWLPLNDYRLTVQCDAALQGKAQLSSTAIQQHASFLKFCFFPIFIMPLPIYQLSILCQNTFPCCQ